jgi:hypothetical protein
MKNKIWPVIFLFLFAPFLAKAATASQLYITQVQTTGGAGKTNEDFVELFNPSASSVNLKGYRLVKRSQNSQTDTLIKSWSSDATVSPESFYLWANSSYTGIVTKPDITTSATLSDDNGVALRFGPNDSGQLIDSFSWGKTANGFNIVTNANPGAGQAIFRKDWYASASTYFIAASKPRNSLVNDMAAAFSQSQNSAKPTAAAVVHSVDQAVLPNASPTINPTDSPIASTSIEAVGETQTPAYPSGSYQNNTSTSSPKNYLILAAGALLALIFLAWKFIFTKPK